MAFDLQSFMQRELKKTGAAPSRRSNKVQSGRAGRKTYQGQKAVSKVGGFRNEVDAIYAPADYELCVVVDSRRGWKSNGEPNRL